MAICLKVTKEQKSWSRSNGWSLPLHPLQVSAWLFVIMFAFLYFGVLVPNMPPGGWQISALTINGIVFIFHIIIHLISVSLNPADANVRAKAHKGPLPTFDRSKHNHVIENEYCHICQVHVGRKSKHCSACNKCVSEFDHHCKWLNNCVGGRNYRLFISCVSSALLASLIIFLSSVTLIVAYFEEASWLFHPKYLPKADQTLHEEINRTTDSPLHLSTFGSLESSPALSNLTLIDSHFLVFIEVRGSIWICVVFVTAALSLLAIALLGHLLGFHIFLMCQNFSTYDYIVHKRDQTAPAGNQNDKPKPRPKLDCHFNLLQQIKTKKGNQISPKSQDNAKEELEEWEMHAPSQRRSSDAKKPVMPIVSEASNSGEENPLENAVGNVYLGSPHRRRHYLEPISVQQKSTSPNSKNGKKEVISVKKQNDPKELEKADEDGSQDNNNSPSTSQNQIYAHGGTRRHHRSPSPAPLLSPIFESEISSGSAIISWKHRSVSEQSLHTLDESEEDVTSVPSTCTVQIETPASRLSREDSGSLSNLFLSKDELEDNIEDNNNTLVEEDNRVHEVCIVPQSVEDNRNDRNVSDSLEIVENSDRCSNDPFINGDVWAYASKNGCHVRDGLVSFKRSCSMQDNDRLKKTPSDPLTRCCSEDELKSAQRMSKLQRRLSEDHDLWVLRGSGGIPQTWKEHSPKAGVSATAVYCVEEQEESFRIPGIPFGIKRKYNHFSVPNHIVLPCSNSVHPESRKRTRPVGSKPPQAFHA